MSRHGKIKDGNTTISFVAEESLRDGLDLLAKQQRRTRSQLIRIILSDAAAAERKSAAILRASEKREAAAAKDEPSRLERGKTARA